MMNPPDRPEPKQNDSPKEAVSQHTVIHTSDSSIPDAQVEVGLRERYDAIVNSDIPDGMEPEDYFFEQLTAIFQADKATAIREVLDRLEADSHLEEQPYGQNALRARVVPVASINNERRRIARLQPPTAGEGERGEAS